MVKSNCKQARDNVIELTIESICFDFHTIRQNSTGKKLVRY
jgi:hypothetical protein